MPPQDDGAGSVDGVPLVNLPSIVAEQSSKSLKNKIAFMGKMLADAAAQHSRLDPVQVDAGSSQLVLSVIWKYAGVAGATRAGDVKQMDTINNAINALRWVYINAKHTGNWTVARVPRSDTVYASGNPLEANPEVNLMRKTLRRYLKRLGKKAKSTMALQPSMLISIFDQFVCVPQNEHLDRRDILCHAINVAGANVGLRFDEVKLIQMSHVTVSDEAIRMVVKDPTKNRDTDKLYNVIAWPGEHFSTVAAMDPFMALFLWMICRGSKDGPLFCDIIGEGLGQMLAHNRPFPVGKYKKHMQQRALQVGWGEHEAKSITGHSIKRCGVQTCRMLKASDIWIMERYYMTSMIAYMRYTEICDDTNNAQLPTFTDVKSFLSHAKRLESDEAYAAQFDSSDEEGEEEPEVRVEEEDREYA